MATDVRNITFVQTGDAEFQSWITAVIAQLVAIGLTQTADTGQIDAGTVARPGTTNTQAGYAIFRFNDTAHATRPIFMRIAFGTGSALTTPSMWVTLGTITDGAGTITGTWRSALQRSITGNATPVTCHAAYDTVTGAAWANWPSIASGSALVLLIARTCDPVAETPDDKGVVWNWTSTGGDIEFAPWATLISANMTFAAAPLGTTLYTYYDPATGAPVVWKYVGWCASGEVGEFTVPGILMCHYPQFGWGQTVTVAPAGVDRTYVALADPSYSATAWSQLGASGERLLMVWE